MFSVMLISKHCDKHKASYKRKTYHLSRTVPVWLDNLDNYTLNTILQSIIALLHLNISLNYEFATVKYNTEWLSLII